MGIFFIFFASLAIASALGVVFFKNPINSAMSLILNLLTVAAIYAQLNAHFLAAVQIIVYAGAIMVLVLFVLMLLNVKHEAGSAFAKPSLSMLLSILVVISFLAVVVPSFYQAFPGAPEVTKQVVGSVKSMGEILYTQYVFPFEAASLLIMAAMVGAIMLSKRTSHSKT